MAEHGVGGLVYCALRQQYGTVAVCRVLGAACRRACLVGCRHFPPALLLLSDVLTF